MGERMEPRAGRGALSGELSAAYRSGTVRAVNRDGLYYHLSMEAAGLAPSEPGAFFMIGPGDASSPPTDPLLMRPMSVLDHQGDNLDILFKVVGRGTELLAAAKPGDSLRLLGPLGRPFSCAANPKPILVGGGAGVPPLCFLSRRLSAEGIAHRVLFGFNSADDVPEGALSKLSQEAEIFTLDGRRGQKGHPVAALEGDREASRIQACGPGPMLEALKKVRLPGEAMELSMEERMACGMGFCRGCVTPVKDDADWRYATVCRQGPVFDVDELVDVNEAGEVCLQEEKSRG